MIRAVGRMLALINWLAWSVLLVSPLPAEEAAGQKPFALKDGQRVLFLGDSITYGDMYIQYIDAYLYTRFPEWHISVFNRGIPSETAAGTSESTHEPPRPDVHTRFSTTVPPLKPDVVFICYGMNDGIYQSPNATILDRYKAGMTRLVERVRAETEAEPIVLTPPPFDYRPFASKQKPEDQAEPDYRFPAEDYDKTLASFAAWLVTQRDKGLKVPVIDLHTALSKLLKERRAMRDDFRLAPDGIHPDATGHWLTAQTILEALHAPHRAAFIVAKAPSDRGGDFVWAKAPLPLPLDPRIEPGMLNLARSLERLGQYKLFVKGLSPPGKYDLKVGESVFATAIAEELNAGLDLAANEKFPPHAISQEVLKLVQQRRQILRDVWIKSDTHPRLASERAQLLKNSTATAEQAVELDAKIRELCQPVELTFTVTRK